MEVDKMFTWWHQWSLGKSCTWTSGDCPFEAGQRAPELLNSQLHPCTNEMRFICRSFNSGNSVFQYCTDKYYIFLLFIFSTSQWILLAYSRTCHSVLSKCCHGYQSKAIRNKWMMLVPWPHLLISQISKEYCHNLIEFIII